MSKVIAFDLGGVILDFTHRNITSKFSNISGKCEPEIFDFIFNSGLEKDYDTGKISTQQFFEKIKSFLEVEISLAQFSKFWTEIFSEKPGMRSLLNNLKRMDNKITLLSNTNELHFSYCMKTFPFLTIFDEYFVSYKMGVRKPSAEIFRMMKEKLNDDFIFIDDLKENADAAAREGIISIHFISISDLEIKFKELNVNY